MKMPDDPVEDIYTFVERAYIRLQAGDVLIRCLEDESMLPIQQMVESLVMAGPYSLNELRQVLAETNMRRLQVEDDLRQVVAEMKRVLKGFGLDFPDHDDFHEALLFTPLELMVLMSKQGVDDGQRQSACLRVFNESRDLLSNLNGHLRLLAEIELYILDWSWGLSYQMARQRRGNPTTAVL